MRMTMDAAPTRNMVIGGGDINKQLGKDKYGNTTGDGVGEYEGFLGFLVFKKYFVGEIVCFSRKVVSKDLIV